MARNTFGFFLKSGIAKNLQSLQLADNQDFFRFGKNNLT
jgi:hypothetical protein